MTPEQKESNQHDQILQPRAGGRVPKRNKTILELKAALAPLRILNDRRQYRLTELQELANNNNIDTKIERVRETKGWQGQQKGLFKGLWERGWIDVSQLEKYTMDPAKDEDGELLAGAEDWSLKCIMASCLDFAEEMMALQHVRKELGVSVIITPKFHAELAGEGIEYSWGVSKGVYRRKPLNSKRNKESFKALVKACTCREVLSTTTVRKLSQRARAYVCAYFLMHKHSETQNENSSILRLPIIEKLMKAFKTHRTAEDFDSGFLNGFAPSIDNVLAMIDKC